MAYIISMEQAASHKQAALSMRRRIWSYIRSNGSRLLSDLF
jgi:hypothetical protein